MNNEIEVGEFVRLKQGYIGTVENINDFREPIMKYAVDIPKRDLVFVGDNDIVNHSKNIINLIEIGDYVNGKRVIGKAENNLETIYICLGLNETIHNENEIKSIVTKEQYKSVEYVF